MKIRLNKQYLLLLILFYTLIFNELLNQIVPIFQYEDELIALAAIPLFVLQVFSGRKIRNRTGTVLYILGFTLCGLLGSVYFQYQPFLSVAMPDLLLCLKFWLTLYTAKELFRRFDVDRFSRKLFFHVKLITWVFVLLTIANYLFELFPFFDERYGLQANSLFFGHPVSLAGTCSLLIIIAMALKPCCKGVPLCIVLLSVVMATTLRSKAIANVIVFGLMYYLLIVRKQKLTFWMVLLIVPVAVIVGWSQFEYYFLTLGEGSARYQLWVKSFQIAADHFPVGSGFGTYGSYYSVVKYSKLYVEYGLSNIWGLSENFSAFACDSFWPMVIAQFGYLGTAFYAGVLVKLVQSITKLKKVERCYYTSCMAAMAYLIIDSTASTAFVHPLSMPMALWIGILLAQNRQAKTRENDKELGNVA